jgi:hypothetical protein
VVGCLRTGIARAHVPIVTHLAIQPLNIITSLYTLGHTFRTGVHISLQIMPKDISNTAHSRSESRRKSHKRKRNDARGEHESAGSPISPKKRKQSDHGKESPLIELLSPRGEKKLYAIQQRICELLEIGDVICLTRTIPSLECLYRRLIPTQWGIQKILSKYFQDVLGFRTVQGICNALIYSTSALEFFSRTSFADSPLELVAREGDAGPLCAFLEREGYSLFDRVGSRHVRSSQLRFMTTYWRHNGRSISLIRLAEYGCAPLQAVLQESFMTASLNFISANKAYALFPSPTFIHKQTAITEDPNERLHKYFFRYQRLGWTARRVVDSCGAEEIGGHLGLHRWIGDERTWAINLKPAVCPDGMIPETVTECANFYIDDGPIPEDVPGYSFRTAGISSYGFTHPGLKYQYLLADQKWKMVLEDKLKPCCMLQYTGCDPDHRPRDCLMEFNDGGLSKYSMPNWGPGAWYKNGLEPPRWWEFFDDMVPTFRDGYRRDSGA